MSIPAKRNRENCWKIFSEVLNSLQCRAVLLLLNLCIISTKHVIDSANTIDDEILSTVLYSYNIFYDFCRQHQCLSMTLCILHLISFLQLTWWKGGVITLSVPAQNNVRRAKGESGCTQNNTNISTPEPYHIPSQSLPSTYSYFLCYFFCATPLHSERMGLEHKLKQTLILLACYFFQEHFPIVKVREYSGSPKCYKLHPYFLSLLFADAKQKMQVQVCVWVRACVYRTL